MPLLHFLSPVVLDEFCCLLFVLAMSICRFEKLNSGAVAG